MSLRNNMENKKITFEMALEFEVNQLLHQTSSLIMATELQRKKGVTHLRNGYNLEDLQTRLEISLKRFHMLKNILNLPTVLSQDIEKDK